jgi:mono/diheme cytochrome c family protein
MARAALALAWLLTLVATSAVGREDVWRVAEDNAAWRGECGACHMPYPPAMLPAEDWLIIMNTLDRHFGANASLDEKTLKEILAYLERNGGRAMFSGSADELPRITATGWFAQKHQSAIRLWRKGRVRSLADCLACHQGRGS